MRYLIATLALAASILPAAASGGLDCTADDAKVKFTLHGGVTRGMGGPLFQFEGSLDILDTSVAQDLRSTSFSREHVAQYWFDDKDLRLGLYRERDGDKEHGYVDLTVLTRFSGEEGRSEGTYELTVYDTSDPANDEGRTFAGKASCFVE